MKRHKKVGVAATLAASASAAQRIIRAWRAVYKASPENPWRDGQRKKYLIFDRHKLVFLDVGGSMSTAVRAMLLPLLPRREDGGHPNWHTSDALGTGQRDYHCFACVDNPFERLVRYLYPSQIEPFLLP